MFYFLSSRLVDWHTGRQPFSEILYNTILHHSSPLFCLICISNTELSFSPWLMWIWKVPSPGPLPLHGLTLTVSPPHSSDSGSCTDVSYEDTLLLFQSEVVTGLGSKLKEEEARRGVFIYKARFRQKSKLSKSKCFKKQCKKNRPLAFLCFISESSCTAMDNSWANESPQKG